LGTAKTKATSRIEAADDPAFRIKKGLREQLNANQLEEVRKPQIIFPPNVSKIWLIYVGRIFYCMILNTF